MTENLPSHLLSRRQLIIVGSLGWFGLPVPDLSGKSYPTAFVLSNHGW